jgi:hypothetical protein
VALAEITNSSGPFDFQGHREIVKKAEGNFQEANQPEAAMSLLKREDELSIEFQDLAVCTDHFKRDAR